MRMRGIHTFFILVGIIIAYIFLINVVVSLLVQYPSFQGDGMQKEGNSGFNVDLRMSDSVSVTVARQRFYGRVLEFIGGKSKVSYLYLFNFLKLPLEVHGIHFLYFHIGIVVLLFILFIVLSALERRT